MLLNYPCRREWLEPLVPSGTELDTWQGEALVSLVGFLFTDTRLLGVPVPFHRTFEEVNLRFYVRRRVSTGSEAEFITEHYWGYTRQRNGGTLEYEVVHPPWHVWRATRHTFTGDATALYGPHFADLLRTTPRSAFVAVGSAVEVHVGARIA